MICLLDIELFWLGLVCWFPFVHPSGSCGGRRCPTASAPTSNSQQHNPVLFPATIECRGQPLGYMVLYKIAQPRLHPRLPVNNSTQSIPFHYILSHYNPFLSIIIHSFWSNLFHCNPLLSIQILSCAIQPILFYWNPFLAIAIFPSCPTQSITPAHNAFPFNLSPYLSDWQECFESHFGRPPTLCSRHWRQSAAPTDSIAWQDSCLSTFFPTHICKKENISSRNVHSTWECFNWNIWTSTMCIGGALHTVKQLQQSALHDWTLSFQIILCGNALIQTLLLYQYCALMGHFTSAACSGVRCMVILMLEASP